MIFVGAHHKTGSSLFRKIFSDVARKLGLSYFCGSQADLPPETDIWCNEYSLIDARALLVVRGVHVIRHPLEVIASGYRWHLICQEKWCVTADTKVPPGDLSYNFEGQSYQEKLRTLSEPEGISFEMKGRSLHSIKAMYAWAHRRDPRFLTIRYEDVAANFDGSLARVFTFVGLDPVRCLPIAARHDLNRLRREDVEALRHVTNKKGGMTWQRHFSNPAILRAFREIFPQDVFQKLGYPDPEAGNDAIAEPGKADRL
jgi:hypothetical protein